MALIMTATVYPTMQIATSIVERRRLYYADSDSDGYGNVASSLLACTQPDGYVANPNDCNDESSALSPATIWYADADTDGFGDSVTTATQCLQPAGYVLE